MERYGEKMIETAFQPQENHKENLDVPNRGIQVFIV